MFCKLAGLPFKREEERETTVIIMNSKSQCMHVYYIHNVDVSMSFRAVAREPAVYNIIIYTNMYFGMLFKSPKSPSR